jgi:mono/diheme cytochrome c family protein
MGYRHGVPALLQFYLILLLAGCSGGIVDSEERIDLGKEIYAGNCATCHGANGEGRPNWMLRGEDGLYLPPPHDNTGHTWHHSDGLLFQIVKYGGASLGIPNFQSGMPAFEQTLDDSEIRAVITYLKTLWESEQREFQGKASERDPFPP